MALKDTEFYFEYPIRHGDFEVGYIEGKCEVMHDATLEPRFYSSQVNHHTIPVTNQDGMLKKVTEYLWQAHREDIWRCFDEAAAKAEYDAKKHTYRETPWGAFMP